MAMHMHGRDECVWVRCGCSMNGIENYLQLLHNPYYSAKLLWNLTWYPVVLSLDMINSVCFHTVNLIKKNVIVLKLLWIQSSYIKICLIVKLVVKETEKSKKKSLTTCKLKQRE